MREIRRTPAVGGGHPLKCRDAVRAEILARLADEFAHQLRRFHSRRNVSCTMSQAVAYEHPLPVR